MKPDFARWERTRSKGKWWFIVVFGVLGWGVTCAVLSSVVFPLAMGEGVTFRATLKALVLFPLGGVAWGAWMWSFNEKAYFKAKNSEPNNSVDDLPAGAGRL